MFQLRRSIVLGLLVAAIAASFPLASPAEGASRAGADAAWPQFNFGPAHNGWNYRESTIGVSNVSTLAQSWRSGFSQLQSDDIVARGSVFFATQGKLHAVNLVDGRPGWSRAWSGINDPAYFGGVLVATNASKPYMMAGLSPSGGNVLWHVSSPVAFSPPTVANGIVYVTAGSTLQAYRVTTGRLIWNVSYSESTRYVAAKGGGFRFNVTTPAEYDGLIYATSTSGRLYAVGARKGRPIWSVNIKPRDFGTTVIEVSQDHVLVLTPSEVISVNHSSGRIQWRYTQNYEHTGGGLPFMSAAYGLVYEGGLGTGPHGGNPVGEALSLSTGKPKWGFETDGYVAQTPTVANGVLYAADPGGNLFTFNASTGAALGSHPIGGAAGSTYAGVVGSRVVEANQVFALP